MKDGVERLLAVSVALGALAVSAARIDVHPQCFDAGGWKLDVQFMDVMGSPYLLAHGRGLRVADAKAVVDIPHAGAWRVWVRARKWIDGAGAFKVRVGDQMLARTFGVSQSEWAWEDGGEVALPKGPLRLALADSDGFDGRCAGVVLTDDGAKPTGALKLDEKTVAETVISSPTPIWRGMVPINISGRFTATAFSALP